MVDDFQDKYYFGHHVDLTDWFFLADALKCAETTKPQPLRHSLGDKAPSEKLCVAVHANQIAFADAKSCRFIASAGTASCRTFFLRNPKTSATVVAHLTACSGENELLEAIKKIAQRSDELDMYIMGGEGRCDYTREQAWLDNVNDINTNKYEDGTAEDIEKTLDNIFSVTDDLGIKIKPKVINLFNAKQTQNAVVDTVTGDFFYVPNAVIEPFILLSPKDHPLDAPLLKIFDGLKNQQRL